MRRNPILEILTSSYFWGFIFGGFAMWVIFKAPHPWIGIAFAAMMYVCGVVARNLICDD